MLGEMPSAARNRTTDIVMSPRNVLFLGHDASRTGAPLLLLELIKWLKNNSAINPSVLLKRGGVLESDYAAIAPTRAYDEEWKRMNKKFLIRVFRKLRLARVRQPDLSRLYPVEEFPTVYANTIDTCDMALQLAGTGCRVVQHVHELAYTTEVFGATEMLKRAV